MQRRCVECDDQYETTLPPDFFTQKPKADLCDLCLSRSVRRRQEREQVRTRAALSRGNKEVDRAPR